MGRGARSGAPVIQVVLDDGSLAVPEAMVEPLREEWIAVGSLTVVRAQVLVEKWTGLCAGRP